MAASSQRDAQRLLTSLQPIYAARTIEQFAQVVMRELLVLVPSDMAAYNELDLSDGHFANWALPDIRTPALEAAFARNVTQHPGLRRFICLADPGPHPVMELVRRQDWRRTAMYDEVWRPLATDDQIVMFIAAAPRVAAVSVSRGTHDYTDRERDLLEALRPHLRVARASVDALARAEDRSAQLLAQLGSNVVTLDRAGAIRSATPGAVDLVRRYFSAPTRPPSYLPEPLIIWHRELRRSLTHADYPGPTQALTVRKPFGTLRAHAIFDREETVLVFEHRVQTADHLEELPLTSRERQIVVLLADGATNAAIGASLDISALTVKKHLEHIYDKLGVASRAATVARALGSALRCLPIAMLVSTLLES